MRLRRLTITNWACHSRLEIDLTRSLQIEGRNGAGKSSILEAIRFAFASSALGYKGKVKNGTRESRVLLEFAKDGKNYLIDKSLSVDKSSRAQLSCDDNVVADNPSSVSEALDSMLSENVLDRLLYIPQGGLTSIVDRLKQKGGKQELDSLFGLDRFERVWQSAGEKIKEEKARFTVFDEQLAKYPENLQQEYTVEITNLKSLIAELGNDLTNLNAKLESISEKLARKQERLDEFANLKRELESLKERSARFDVSKAGFKKDAESVERELAAVGSKKSELARLRGEASSLKKYLGFRELLGELSRLGERMEDIGSIDSMKDELEKINYVLAREEDLRKEFDANSVILENLQADVTRCSHELEQQKSYRQSLDELTEATKCPRCGQKISEVHIFSEKQTADLHIRKLDSRHANLKAKLKGVREVVGKFRDELDGMRDAEARANELRKSIKEKTRELEDLKRRAVEVGGRLSLEGYAQESLREVEENIMKLQSAEGKISILEDEVAAERELLSKRDSLSQILSKLKTEEEEISRKIAALSYDDSEFIGLSGEKDSLIEEKSNIKSELTQTEYQMRETKGKVDELENRIADYLQVLEDRDRVGRRIKLLVKARDVFHTDKGLPKYLRDRYVSSLGDMLTYFFKRINQNPAYRDVEFDKDYNLRLNSTTGTLSLDQLSGGEKVQLAVAFRIALIEMLSPVRLLILDEPFGSLDQDHREVLGEALNKMGADWQIIMVTHIHVDSLQLETFELEGY
ncbi:MAG: SMC family ATPase [Candidatus Altiarchaeota archaeon]